ncbi:MAG: ABC transporter ATP-binding protein/permease [Methanobrevibacter sp.]|nr:ABC transporter ATP-binding protein/permease [Methanobrevibacter sp.]
MKQIMKGYRSLYLVVIVLSIISASLMTFFSIQLGGILDSISTSDNQLIFQISQCLFSMIAWFLTSWCYSYFRSNYVKNIILNLKNKLFKGYLSQDFSERCIKNDSNFLNEVTKNIDLIQENLLIPRTNIVASMASIIMSVLAIFFIEWRLALLFLFFSLITIFLSQIPGKLMSKATILYSEKSKDYLAEITNFIEGFEQIKLLNIQKWMQQVVQNTTSEFEESRKKYQYRKDLGANTGTFLSFFSQVACMVIGIFFVRNNLLTVGLLVASIQLLNGVFGPLQTFLYNKNLMKSTDAVLLSLQRFLDQNAMVEDYKKSTISHGKISSISIKELAYQIESKKLFKDFSFEFEKGKKYALIGPSGAGKSTLAKLILNYYPKEMYEGSICIDDKYNYEISSEDLYKEIAFIQKSHFIVEGSVLDNIKLGRKLNLVEKLQESLGFDEMFLKKKLFRNQPLISEGEKQRIDLARFLNNTYSAYIFDEPTSNLDPERTKKVMDYILSIKDAIVIVITHDQDSEKLKQFDEVICL